MKIRFETKVTTLVTDEIDSASAISHDPAGRRKVPPKLREAVFEDYSRIAALQLRNGLSIRPFPDWVSQWKGNPAYEESRGRIPIGWVLETPEGEIVGLIGNIPFSCHLRDRELRAASACAWVVDPAYRSQSMALLDRLMSQPDTDLIISTTVSSNSEPALKLFEWEKAPIGTWDRSAFWITHYRGFVGSVLKLKSVPLSGLTTYPVAAGLYCRDLFRDGAALWHGGNADLELCSGFDDRFDAFWDELKRQNHHILLASRTRKTLAWHFRYPLMRQRLWILAATRGSRLVAYTIFDRQDNEAYGLKRVRLVDFQALKGYENNLYPALASMLRTCRQEEIHILENVGCWLDRPGMPRIPAAYNRTLPSALYYYKAADPDLATTLADPRVWAPTTYDGDASL